MENNKYIDWLNAYIAAVEKGDDRKELRRKFEEIDSSTLLKKLLDRADTYLDAYGLQRNIERDALKEIRDNVLMRYVVDNKDDAFWQTTCSTADALSIKLLEENTKRAKAYSNFMVGVMMDILDFINTPSVVNAWEGATIEQTA